MTNRAEQFHTVVIGAGSGGLTVAVSLQGLGHQVALIEAADVGGDCTNVGCIPSKALLHQSRQGDRNPFAHVRTLRDNLRDHETEEFTNQSDSGLTFIHGRGRLLDPSTVEVTHDDGEVQTVKAEHIVICTGSKPRIIPLAGLTDSDEANEPLRTDEALLTNENIWNLSEAPRHLAIIGGGAIALEMADAFHRIGSAVTVVELAERILGPEDPEVSEIVTAAMTGRGINIRTGVSAERFDAAARRLELSDGSSVDDIDNVLMAVGRVPRSEGLNLDRVGVATTKGSIDVDDWGRTSVPGVFAVGDVTGSSHTTHGANAAGRRLAQSIGLPVPLRVGALPVVPGAIYCDPEVASVGLSLAELEADWPESARRHIRVDLADTDRGYVDGLTHGAVIVDIARLTGSILRASIVGPGASDAIGIFTLAIQEDISAFKLYRMVHPYPSHAIAIAKVFDTYLGDTLTALPAEGAGYLSNLPNRLKARISRL